MKHRIFVAARFWFALALPALAAEAGLELPLLFTDGAVLQRDHALPVWGQAAPGARVQVEFDGARAQAVAGADGRWSLQLPAHAAGGPYTLVVRAGNEEKRIGDVLVGEVWLASGQSNMEWPVATTLHGKEDIAAAGDTALRHYKVPKSWAATPQAQLAGGRWLPATPQNVGEFSAAGYAFARELRKVLGVPVGIIDSTWGGSSIEAWMDASMLGLDAAALEAKMAERRAVDERVEAATRARLGRLDARRSGVRCVRFGAAGRQRLGRGRGPRDLGNAGFRRHERRGLVPHEFRAERARGRRRHGAGAGPDR